MSQENARTREIRAAVDAWHAALTSKNIDRIAACYTDDAVIFDVKMPFRLGGIDAIRKVFADAFPYFPETYGVEIRDFVADAGAEVAAAHWLFRFSGFPPEHTFWMRSTVTFVRRAGVWKIAHAHLSLPMDSTCESVVFTNEI